MKAKKKVQAQHTTWGHHDTMIVNLRDWVSRELHILRSDLSREVSHLADDPNMLKLLKSADDMNVQLFDLIRSVIDRAEIESRKSKKTTEVVEDADAYTELDA